MLLQTMASISIGPLLCKPVASAWLNCSAVSILTASTPIPPAIATQSRLGLSRSKISCVVGPGIAPTFLSSPRRIAYERLLNMTVVTLRFSRACVHNACTVYIALPSPEKHSTDRSGQATAAPVALRQRAPDGSPCGHGVKMRAR